MATPELPQAPPGALRSRSLLHVAKRLVQGVQVEDDNNFLATHARFKQLSAACERLKTHIGAYASHLKGIYSNSVSVSDDFNDVLITLNLPTDGKSMYMIKAADAVTSHALVANEHTSLKLIDEALLAKLSNQSIIHKNLDAKIAERNQLREDYLYYKKKVDLLQSERDKRSDKATTKELERLGKNSQKLAVHTSQFTSFNDSLINELNALMNDRQSVYGPLMSQFMSCERMVTATFAQMTQRENNSVDPSDHRSRSHTPMKLSFSGNGDDAFAMGAVAPAPTVKQYGAGSMGLNSAPPASPPPAIPPISAQVIPPISPLIQSQSQAPGVVNIEQAHESDVEDEEDDQDHLVEPGWTDPVGEGGEGEVEGANNVAVDAIQPAVRNIPFSQQASPLPEPSISSSIVHDHSLRSPLVVNEASILLQQEQVAAQNENNKNAKLQSHNPFDDDLFADFAVPKASQSLPQLPPVPSVPIHSPPTPALPSTPSVLSPTNGLRPTIPSVRPPLPNQKSFPMPPSMVALPTPPSKPTLPVQAQARNYNPFDDDAFS